MWTKKQNIDNVKRKIGWVYHDLKWLTDEEAKRKNQERDKILKSISNKVNYAFKQSKIYCGVLSPGCLTCGQGAWSCMYINCLCTANCFFCPQDRKMKKESLPSAEGITFDEPNSYVDYLEKFGFRGVGFSGGETMLVFEKLLLYIIRIRQKFGKKFYLWVYTNGDLVNAEKLKRLKRAGLDEIRFNISARNYDLRPVELATKFINTVTVEIPAIPEDYEVLKKCIFKMQEIGVNHLNIHQLTTKKYNYRNFINRNYTFLHLASGIPILESEITALRLIRYAVDNNIRLSINYCSDVYKNRFQGRGHRKRAASLSREDYEEETDSGYIRHLSVKDSLTNIKSIVKVLRENKCREKLWSLDATKTEISFHSSILKYINFGKYNLIIRYSEPPLIVDISFQEEYKEIKLNSSKKVSEKEFAAYRGELTSTGVESFRKLFIENMNEIDVFKYFYENYNLKTKENIKNMEKEAEILTTLKTWEQLETGFSEIC
jgi:pyruvate formate-lyase activating enzyme-like uncharacterized protein